MGVAFEAFVRAATFYLAAAVEIGAAVVVGFAAGEAMLRAALGLAKRDGSVEPKEEIRLRLARWLALAIEFELAADIIRTMIAPTWNDIGQLAAIIVIRTALNYFLRQETVRGELTGTGSATEETASDETKNRRHGIGK